MSVSLIPEASPSPTLFTNKSNLYDVYLGRGNAVVQNHGNRIYRSTVKQLKQRYLEAKGHRAKAQIAQNVIEMFARMGGTFYFKQETTQKWEVAPMGIVLKKVKQALREKAIKNKTSRPSSRHQSSNEKMGEEEKKDDQAHDGPEKRKKKIFNSEKDNKNQADFDPISKAGYFFQFSYCANFIKMLKNIISGKIK